MQTERVLLLRTLPTILTIGRRNARCSVIKHKELSLSFSYSIFLENLQIFGETVGNVGIARREFCCTSDENGVLKN